MNTPEQEIQALKSRIALLEQRIDTLEGKHDVAYDTPAQTSTSVANSSIEVVSATPPPPPREFSQSQPASNQPPTVSQQPSDTFLERKVGKYVMGIVASVLVLLSLVGFAQYITPHLTALSKVIIMYLVSALFTTVGLMRMWKDSKYKALFTALAACGVSAVYVTSLVGHFAFSIIGTWALVAILMTWIACLIPLSRHGGKIFSIICNAGIIIASMLCTFNWSSSLVGIAVYMSCLIALYWALRTATFKGDWFLLIQLPVVCILLLLLGTIKTADSNTVAEVTSSAVVYVAFLLSQLYYKDDNKHAILLFLYAIATLTAIIFSQSILFVETPVRWNSIICFIALAALLVVLYRKHRAQSPVVFYLLFFPYAIYMSALSYNDMFSQHIGHLAPSALLFMLIGAKLKELPMRLAGVFYILLWCLFSNPTWEHVIIAITTSLLLLIHTIRHYNVVDKYSFTIILIAGVLMLSNHDMINNSMAYVLLGILGIALCTPLFRNNFATKEVENNSVLISYATTLILIFIGVMMLLWPQKDALAIAHHTFNGTEPIALGLVILTTVALSIANLKKSYTISIIEEHYASCYNGLKFSVVLFAILHSLNAVNFVVSISGLALAVLFIIVGFKFLLRGCRLYGLVVSLLCVIKLVMFDIQYESTIMRPAGLLFSGILCFGISWIYSRLERKIK